MSQTETASLHLKLFGGFKLSDGSGEVRLRGDKLKALLAVLASEYPVAQRREFLVTLLWGSHSEKQARQNLRQALVRLRKAIRTDLVTSDDELVGLSDGALTIDVHEFDRTVSNRNVESAETAIEHYDGTFLPDLDVREEMWEEWLRLRREKLDGLAVDAMILVGEHRLGKKQYTEALDLGQRALVLDYFREDGHCIVMRALAGLGRRAQAIQHFERFVADLERELGTGPEEVTQACRDEIDGTQTIRTRTAQRVPTDGKRNTSSDLRTIAVLPFENMSPGKAQNYFADGITEDMIAALSSLPQLFVIGRNTSFSYRGKTLKEQQIGTELGVRYLLEGSVRKAGKRIRITAQLIDCHSSGTLWAGKFDRDLKDVFEVQDDVIENIVSALELTLSSEEQGRLKNAHTQSVEAYDFVLRGITLLSGQSKKSVSDAREMFERAIELDPDYSYAYARLAVCHIISYINRWGDSPDHCLEESFQLAQKAVTSDELNPVAHAALGNVCLWKKQHDRAIEELSRAITLQPNFANAHFLLGWALHFVGRSQEGIDAINRGVRLDPRYSDVHLDWLAQAHFQLGQFEQAAELLQRRIVRNPDTDISRVLLAATYGHLGRAIDAKAMWEEALRINPKYSLEHRRRVLPYKDPADFEKIVDGLRKARLAL